MSDLALSINSRIVFLIDALEKGRRVDFAEKIGVPQGSLHGIVGKRQSEPYYRILNKILINYPNVNSRWLMLGEGEPFVNETQKQEKKEVVADSLLISTFLEFFLTTLREQITQILANPKYNREQKEKFKNDLENHLAKITAGTNFLLITTDNEPEQ